MLTHTQRPVHAQLLSPFQTISPRFFYVILKKFKKYEILQSEPLYIHFYAILANNFDYPTNSWAVTNSDSRFLQHSLYILLMQKDLNYRIY